MFWILWQWPRWGWVKCNVDVSYSVEFNRTGIGMCVCDEERILVLAKSILLPILHPVNVGDVLGLCYALVWLSDMTYEVW